ncbi:hypothetical protein [Brevundimonas diminuta]|uniref:hypothetical protein n=1 Tax=Brevundimonas diminuta TaxID=293 RepID=UPI003D9A4458
MAKQQISLRLSEEQKARIAKAEENRQAASDRYHEGQAVKAKRKADNASLRVQGAKIYENDQGKMISGYRPTCFNALLRGKDDELRAVSWLEDLVREASGENAKERRPDFIRGSAEGAPGQNFTQRMIDASRELKIVEVGLRPWEARLLFDLLKPDEALLTRWRAVVHRVTGEVNPQAQGARVRAACESLSWVKQVMASEKKAA